MKERRLIAFLITISVAVVCLSSCAPPPQKLRSLTKGELNQFLTANNVTPLAVKKIGDATVIFYETEKSMGYYALSMDAKGTIVKSQASTNNNASMTQVSIGGTATGVPFATLVINDDNLREKGYRALVTFSDGYTAKELVSGKRGHIAPHLGIGDFKVSIESVSIVDKENNVIFKNP
ncbi:MAG TPA: hypothetical protein VGK02_03710 [Candidatus Aquicultor sp.]|jgi:hypothetical protein